MRGELTQPTLAGLRHQPRRTRTTTAGQAASAWLTISQPPRSRTSGDLLVTSFPSLQKPEKRLFVPKCDKIPNKASVSFPTSQKRTAGAQSCRRRAKPKKCLKKILNGRQALSCSKIDGDAPTEWICQNSSRLPTSSSWNLCSTRSLFIQIM